MAEVDLTSLRKLFIQKFNSEPEVCAYAPGRVNLIGEHVDYNDGLVLPFALPFQTFVLGKLTSSNLNVSRIYSATFDEFAEFTINPTLAKGEPKWANYVKGVVYQYLSEIPEGTAFDALIWSNVPLGSGLSSSAALEVSVATFLESLLNISTKISKVEKAKRCQKAEHMFADTPCGIMDQFISVLGEKGKLLLIDCRTQMSIPVSFGSGDSSAVVVVTNSKVKHQLSTGEYPLRVNQCCEAVNIIRVKYPDVTSLRDVTTDMLLSCADKMSEVVFARARHVVSEIERTLKASESLSRGDFSTTGRLMNESHTSLSKDYEVSCPELDALVKYALQVPGVYGSRMTGGGFGGCSVTLVESSAVPELKAVMRNAYLKEFGINCEFYDAKPSAGAGVIDLNMEGKEASPAGDVLKTLQSSLNWIVPITVVAVALGILIAAKK